MGKIPGYEDCCLEDLDIDREETINIGGKTGLDTDRELEGEEDIII